MTVPPGSVFIQRPAGDQGCVQQPQAAQVAGHVHMPFDHHAAQRERGAAVRIAGLTGADTSTSSPAAPRLQQRTLPVGGLNDEEISLVT